MSQSDKYCMMRQYFFPHFYYREEKAIELYKHLKMKCKSKKQCVNLM